MGVDILSNHVNLCVSTFLFRFLASKSVFNLLIHFSL